MGELETKWQGAKRRPFNPNLVVPISVEEYDEWCRPWKYTLVVKLLRKKIRFMRMNRRFHRLWARDEDVKVIDLTDEYYLVFLSSYKNYMFAFFEGPWTITDHNLLVQRWRPIFRVDDNEVRKIAVWVHGSPTQISY